MSDSRLNTRSQSNQLLNEPGTLWDLYEKMDLVKSNTKPAKKSVSIYRDVDHKEKVGPLQHKSKQYKMQVGLWLVFYKPEQAVGGHESAHEWPFP